MANKYRRPSKKRTMNHKNKKAWLAATIQSVRMSHALNLYTDGLLHIVNHFHQLLAEGISLLHGVCLAVDTDDRLRV